LPQAPNGAGLYRLGPGALRRRTLLVCAQAPNGAGLYRLAPGALRRRTLLVCAQAPYGAGLGSASRRVAARSG